MLSRAHQQRTHQPGTMASNANLLYEPLFRQLSKDYRSLERENERLREENAEKEARVQDLEERLKKVEEANAHLKQLLFARARTAPRPVVEERPAQPRGKKPGAEGFQRPLPSSEEVTGEKTLVLETCPRCAAPVSAPVSAYTRIIEDIVLNPQRSVIQWEIARHWCRACQRLVHGTVPGILPKTRLGPNVLTYVVIAKHRLNLPYGKIRDSLSLCFGLSVSEGEIATLLDRASRLVGPAWARITEAVKGGKAVHCDETGWFIDGKKVWAWAFATEDAVLYEIAESRGRCVAAEVLGPDFSGTRVTDCLPVYQNLAGTHQICWAHLTREAREAQERDTTNAERQALHETLDGIYADLRAVAETSPWSPAEAARVRRRSGRTIARLRAHSWQDPGCRRLVERLRRFRGALFTCLTADGIPPDNNHAERVLRKLVVQRKISGGNRSPVYAEAHARLMSVLETFRLEGGDLVGKLQELFSSRIGELSGH